MGSTGTAFKLVPPTEPEDYLVGWSLIPESLLLRMWMWQIPELSVFLLNFSVTLSVETIAAKQPTLVGQVIVH